MATHSSVLAWRIPGTGEPGGMSSVGSHRVGHHWSDLAAAAAGEDYTLASVFFFLADIELATDHPLKNSALIIHSLHKTACLSWVILVLCQQLLDPHKKLSRLLGPQFRNSSPLTLFFCSIALHPAPLVRLGDWSQAKYLGSTELTYYDFFSPS